MAARHKDEQLRIRIARLTASSPAAKRFMAQHDKLTGAARIERHIDVVRMGQMLLDMGLLKELVFLDDDIWSKQTPEERLSRFFDVLELKGKLPSGARDYVDVPVLSSIAEIPPVNAVAASEGQSEASALPPAKKTDSEQPAQPPKQPESFGPANVEHTVDGATFITESIPKLTGRMKGLGDGA
ncbi:hypothetical protein QMM96_22245 [Citrobacter freundii]|uniref:hypothetical protein n=1 Tax=Citrobacter freundii TaxID=546 RepID=UPI001A234F3F|nr:hypothetical protein [Citrobacter freundii]MEB2478153.1 hypothetical protein [Citrobacter freundii]HAU6297990.1 hypothetical protein [Citrobacter freundii]HCD1268084.1 hypothetical protein [Citrobacter freundii]